MMISNLALHLWKMKTTHGGDAEVLAKSNLKTSFFLLSLKNKADDKNNYFSAKYKNSKHPTLKALLNLY